MSSFPSRSYTKSVWKGHFPPGTTVYQMYPLLGEKDEINLKLKRSLWQHWQRVRFKSRPRGTPNPP